MPRFSARRLAWLTGRPIAHRGLHQPARAIMENTLPAFEAAITEGYPIETDLQLTADDELVVHHDVTLDRLTGRSERVSDSPLAAIRGVPLTGGGTIPSFGDLLETVAGRVPLLIELKTPHSLDAAHRMAEAVDRGLAGYDGAVALQSFDPNVLLALRARDRDQPVGILAGDKAEAGERLPALERFGRDNMLHAPLTHPDFIGYRADRLPKLSVALARAVRCLPVIAWTIRSESERTRAMRWVDQIIFEGFLPREP